RSRRARGDEGRRSFAGPAVDHSHRGGTGTAAPSRHGTRRQRVPHQAIQPEEAVRTGCGARRYQRRGVRRRRLVSESNIWVVVLAGGVGSRFWPLSTPRRPKQLLPLVTDEPLLV